MKPLCEYRDGRIDHKLTGEKMVKHRKECRVFVGRVALYLRSSASHVCDLEAGEADWTEELAGRYLRAIGAAGMQPEGKA